MGGESEIRRAKRKKNFARYRKTSAPKRPETLPCEVCTSTLRREKRVRYTPGFYVGAAIYPLLLFTGFFMLEAGDSVDGRAWVAVVAAGVVLMILMFALFQSPRTATETCRACGFSVVRDVAGFRPFKSGGA